MLHPFRAATPGRLGKERRAVRRLSRLDGNARTVDVADKSARSADFTPANALALGRGATSGRHFSQVQPKRGEKPRWRVPLSTDSRRPEGGGVGYHSSCQHVCPSSNSVCFGEQRKWQNHLGQGPCGPPRLPTPTRRTIRHLVPR